jgi:hypothetical protein
VESYKGFVFATMDPAVPPLDEYLGEVGRLGLGMVAAHGSARWREVAGWGGSVWR